MSKFPTATYTLVGKWTMANTSLLSAFSWKQGFLENHSQRINKGKAHMNTTAKGQKKEAGIAVPPAQNIRQQTFTMSNSMTTTAPNTTASNWARTMLPLEETTQKYMTAVFNEIYFNRSNSVKIKNMTHMHGVGQIHHALPICGLPPESESGNHITDNTMTQEPRLGQSYNWQASAQDKVKNS